MAPRQPALPIVNVLASALLAAVAMFTATSSACDQRRNVSLLQPVHHYFDRIESQLGHEYPLLLRWSPDRLIGRDRIDCGCRPVRRAADTGPLHARLRVPLRHIIGGLR